MHGDKALVSLRVKTQLAYTEQPDDRGLAARCFQLPRPENRPAAGSRTWDIVNKFTGGPDAGSLPKILAHWKVVQQLQDKDR